MSAPPLNVKAHVDFIAALDKKKNDYEYWLTEQAVLNGIYWGLTALFLLGAPDTLVREDVIQFVVDCWDSKTGGFAGNIGHDAHLLYTLSAIQILATYDALDRVDTDRVVEYVCSLQLPGGAFQGDRFGEVDSRFSFCALACLTLLGKQDSCDVPAAVDFVVRCKNFDGGFGSVPGAESHAGQVFCCVGALALTNSIDKHIDRDHLGWWLAERQLPNGGLNGRPEKLADARPPLMLPLPACPSARLAAPFPHADTRAHVCTFVLRMRRPWLPQVCYSWWCLSALTILDRLHWISAEPLSNFILNAQALEDDQYSRESANKLSGQALDDAQDHGGIADRPGDRPDVFHTLFGVAGLSLLKYPGLEPVDPLFCMPLKVTQRLGLAKEKY
ncbi:hypothetical protein H696_04095 [Fonticula alba]|uniref:Geranylgeranyl transferase type-2 subunit beta n=1 Tax=Fonticula alba TaxID=691883 RepID=A0A058Z832_FONAL|nr:hypothetical protein H696_04095 [Fonticula alba]KCV69687.1 hypothetical protein H696_04095 [Fonticula alba]|eukprot:XP_009496252.1 hypothetical protein H696_04095 [Fonticula alba]